ncbi:hypothetical protein J2847_004300 [Azospirillum agricola]|uniref:hypothetical protein n=1 Tax=Azospirillum agricola TaxID=1720247 RepID=UPI001AE3B745|nr:hypothetical protein [Azospirillum agricola]MBP2230989.1 hypothetical protein [Azospirillum agricola]
MSGASKDVTVVAENGSFRLVACQGRYAVVETRGGRVYGVPTDEAGGRDGAPDDGEGVTAVARWTGEADARALLADLATRGDQLARALR